MPRQEINRSGEMEVFVRAVELAGFSPAARALGIMPSAVSKLVARLERRLDARLINRSLRKLVLTAEGAIPRHRRCKRVFCSFREGG
jgi:DNA-binding transcriptional LysR family regulator